MTIEEQKRYLFERLKLESLRISEQNKKEILAFEQAKCGSILSDYLKNEAWKDDESGDTKVYLVKDIVENVIVSFFALNCGILYSDLEGISLKEEEKEPFERLVKAFQMYNIRNLSDTQREQADKEYNDALNALEEVVESPDRFSYLNNQAESKAASKETERDLFVDTEEKEHATNVHQTFPAIDIKFLCKNKHYIPKINLDFRLGVYIFWELIVPHVLKTAELVGCKYIYLFAADETDRTVIKTKKPIMFTRDYDPYAEEEEEEQTVVLKLVEYYKNELKFNYVTKYKVLKPHFERKCFTLVQEVKNLEENRRSIWISHSLEDNEDKNNMNG